MSTLANSSAEPSYITRLALKSAPFNSDRDAQFFFNGEQIEQRLNLLLHLARSSDKVGVLFAKQGLGKSTLLTQFQSVAGDDLRICRIDAEPSLSNSAIVQQCLRAFGVEQAEVSGNVDHEALLKGRLQRLRKLNIRPLLLLDNVDSISTDSLATLLDWFSWQDDDEFLLQAILSSCKALPELDNIHGRLQRVDLPNLAENELDAYLMLRLESVGYKGELPFNDKELKKLFRESQGNPAIVNQWAHQHLLGIKSNPKLASSMKLTSVTSLLRWTGVTILAISLILLLVFQDKVNSLFTEETVQDSPIEQPIDFEEEVLATVVVDDELSSTQIMEESVPLVNAPVVIENEVDSLSLSDGLDLDLAQVERDELVSLLDELPSSENTAVEQGIVSSPDDVQEEAVIGIKQESQETPTSVVYEKEWIQQQKGMHYTFQLMGSWEHDKVDEFIEKYTLTGDIAEFESDRNGRIWYALIYGVYASKKEALQASSDWPAPLNSLPSWLRRFDSVQKQIKSMD